MKIGILTQPLRNNYGGLLQNYALQTVLKNCGHNVTTIDWDGRFSFKERLYRLRIRLSGFLSSSSSSKRKYVPTKKEDMIISKHTDEFVNKYISHTKTAYSKTRLERRALHLKAQAYIVGSDQVWRPGYNAFPFTMFLDFCQRMCVRRIAYAASFGSDKWEYKSEETKKIKSLAGLFDLITVRESSGVRLCKDYLNIDAVHVLDPTMLLNHEDYERIVVEEKEPVSDGTLFHYILDPREDKKALINHVAESQGLKPFTIMPKCQAENRTKWDVKNRIEDCVFPSVTSWLRGFMDAKLIIVDSFHGAVFSIIFNKPFWVLSNASRGNARFESLLRLFGLEDRMVSADSLSNKFDWSKEIDWERVNEIRQKEIVRCKSLLERALE